MKTFFEELSKAKKVSKIILFSGLFYSFLITFASLILYKSDISYGAYLAEKLIFISAEISSLALIFSFFFEIYFKRFK